MHASSPTSHSGAARRRLVVNGAAAECASATLAELLLELGYAGQKVATALNGAFVSERARAAQAVDDGDQVEIVTARQGG